MNIYKIKNKKNGKIYIGKDTTDNTNYYGSGLLIKRAIRKYGEDSFEKEVLENISDYDVLSTREKYWIKYYNSTDLNIGYNISNGGDGGDTISKHPNRKEICEKISKNSPKKGLTYEEAFGEKYAKEYKQKLSDNHPRKSIKELTGEYYEIWLNNVRKAAENKKGKSIKENNNWSEEQYQKHLNTLSKRGVDMWNNISELNKKKIIEHNKVRGIERRISNIQNFIADFNMGDINKDNYRKYVNKLYFWKRDLSKEDFDNLLPNDFMIKFKEKCIEFKKENIRNRFKNI